MNVFLLDVGSTFIKYMVYDPSLKAELFSDSVPFPMPLINDGVHYEISEEEIRKIIYRIFNTASEKECKSAFICAQMHGYLLRRHNTFGNYISWRDNRGDTSNYRLTNVNFSESGTAIKKNSPLASLCTYEESILAESEFFTLGSYISFLLTGKNITHKTDACASGFFNSCTLEKYDFFDNLVLPSVLDKVEMIGKYRGIDIYAPMGDHQISFWGSGAEKKNAYLLNIGTATQISTLAESEATCKNCEKRPYFSKKRLFTVSGITGGSVLFSDGKFQLEKFLSEVSQAISRLPKKQYLIVGGGGAELIYKELVAHFAAKGFLCEYQKNIILGMEGLKKMANEKCKIKAGTMLSEVCFSHFPLIAKNSGLDFIIIDNEHGAFDYHVINELVFISKMCGFHTIMRLPDNGRATITKYADMGVCSFLLPMTNTASDIERVVEYAKYAPIGKRGISTNRAHTLYNPPRLEDYMPMANENMKLYAQIETVCACENINEILAVNGVDGVFIGPNDLSSDLGKPGNTDVVLPYIEKVAAAAKSAQKLWGMITANQKLIDFSKSCDVNLISCGSEINMLSSGCKKIREMF